MDASTVLNDPSTSNWLKHSLTHALQRDPMDAANDAALLLEILEQRVADLLATHGITLHTSASQSSP